MTSSEDNQGCGGHRKFRGPLSLIILAELDKFVGRKLNLKGHPTDIRSGGKSTIPADDNVTKNHQSEMDNTINTIKDEESYGNPGLPDNTGIPRDPKNARSKKISFWALVISGASLAIDYTMSMMSIQALYYALGGPQNLYGLTFGAYDLCAFLLSPIWGYIADTTGRFKFLFNISSAVNVMGNVIYAFSYLGNAWWMMLLGRLLGGVAMATLGLGSGYIARTTTMQERQSRLITYRISQSIARMVGPFVGYFFLNLPNVTQNSSTTLKVFNFYTSPGWVAAFVVFIIGIAFAVAFTDPTHENEHLINYSNQGENNNNKDTKKVVAAMLDDDAQAQRARKSKVFIVYWLIIGFFSSFLQYAFYCNTFALFAGQYHGLSTQQDQWKTFIGTGIGAVVGAVTMRRGSRLFPHLFNERLLVILGNWTMFTVFMLIIPWYGSTEVPSHVTFYAATGIFGASLVWSSAAVETFYSKKCTQYIDELGEGNISKLLGFYYMATSAGRFAGPLVVGAVTYIATPQGQTSYCPVQWTVNEGGFQQCNDNSTSCFITAEYYYVNGCVLYNAIPFYATMAGIQFVLNVVYHILLWQHWSYLG